MNPFKDKVQITRKQFETELKQLFDITIEKDTLCLYIDTYQCNKHIYKVNNPKVFTFTPLDKLGLSIYHIYSTYIKDNEDRYKQLKTFLNTFTFKHKEYYYN